MPRHLLPGAGCLRDGLGELVTAPSPSGEARGVTSDVSLLPFSYRAGNGWWWVPVVAPMVGATLGTAAYQLFVGLHYPEDAEPAQGLEFDEQKASYLETPDSSKKPECKL